MRIVAFDVLTNSERQTWHDCRQRWYFAYVLLLRTRVMAPVLAWGTIIHAGLEAGLRAAASALAGERLTAALAAASHGVRGALAAYVQAINECGEQPEIREARLRDAEENASMADWAVRHALRCMANDLERLIPLGIEMPIRVPVPDALGRRHRLYLDGVVDVAWWDPDARVMYVDDHKSTTGDARGIERRLLIDPQMTGYVHGVAELVRASKLHPLDGTQIPSAAADHIVLRYNVIRQSQPHVPKINQVKKSDGMFDLTARLAADEKADGIPRGLVSVAACDTTPEVYEDALLQQEARGLPVQDKQRDFLERLRGRGDSYFARFEFYRDAAEIERWRRELWIDARDMRNAARRPDLHVTRNQGHCTRANSMPCPYQPVCLQDEPETRALYRIATRKHEEIDHDGEQEEKQRT